MRIAHITATFPPYWGGTGNVVWYTAEALAQRGHAVTVFTATRAELPSESALPFTVKRLAPWVRAGNAAWAPDLAPHLAPFDVVHLHLPFLGATGSTLRARRLFKWPLVVTYHNRLVSRRPFHGAAFWMYHRWVEPHILHAASTIIAVHDGHRARWLRVWPQVVTLGHGVDPRIFAPIERTSARATLGVDPRQPLALFVGSMDSAHRFKNVEGLLAAWSRVRLPAVLLLVGGGDRRGILTAYAHRLGLDGRIRFVGAPNTPELPRLYSAADVTVLPSRETESFGLVLLESAACGTPVIATDLPGVGDLARELGGWVVPAGNVPELAATLNRVLTLPDYMRQKVGDSARQRVLQAFTWQTVAERLEQIYSLALMERPRHSPVMREPVESADPSLRAFD